MSHSSVALALTEKEKVILLYGLDPINMNTGLKAKIETELTDMCCHLLTHYQADFTPLVGGKVGNLLILVKFVNSANLTEPVARVRTLIFLNGFNIGPNRLCTTAVLTVNITDACSLTWMRMCDGLSHAPIDILEAVLRFRTKKSRVDQLTEIAKILEKLGPGATSDDYGRALAVMGTAQQEQERLALSGHAGSLGTEAINGLTIIRLVEIWKDHPLGVKFGGFTQWGEGNATSVDLNIKGHCFKHVFACEPPWDKSGYDHALLVQESVKWWGRLKISIKKNMLPAVVDSSWFDSNDNLVQVQAFLTSKTVKFEASWILALQPFIVAYQDLALEVSTRMSAALVISEGKKVQVCGGNTEVHGCEFYLVAKMDDANQLGISACYIVEDLGVKLEGNRKTMLWEYQQ